METAMLKVEEQSVMGLSLGEFRRGSNSFKEVFVGECALYKPTNTKIKATAFKIFFIFFYYLDLSTQSCV
jgi:hypothetical protein